MELEKAQKLVNEYREKFLPYCDRIEVAGSIRRERQNVGDLELVCIPKTVTVSDGMFEEKSERDPNFVRLVNKFPRVKGNGSGKYTQIYIEDQDINLDLFMTTPEQWGVIFMIRTGSDQFSKRMMWSIKPGYKVDEGFLKDQEGNIVPCFEEKDFFTITKMDYVLPTLRAM